MAREGLGAAPPRPISSGDIVTCFSEDLGEWSAAQITDLNAQWKQAGVLELDWSGPEPVSVADLGPVQALALTHHAWDGRPSHTNYPWVLPRSCKVIGSLPLLRQARSTSFSSGWQVGAQLAMQRRWDGGDHASSGRPGELKVKASELTAAITDRAVGNVWRLKVEEIARLDIMQIVDAFPTLNDLMLSGNLGTLENAAELNRLKQLKALAINDLFGMRTADCLLPANASRLEWLVLHSVPRDYGSGMRKAWARELSNGCFTAVTGLRSPEWLAENLDNPLRDWDGREHISAAKFRKSVAQYKATRRAVLAILADRENRGGRPSLVQIGVDFGNSFNKLAHRDDFIETEEREELFAALTGIPVRAAELSEEEVTEASDALVEGLDAVREW